MFKERLKKDLDNLSPSNRVKEEILKQIYEDKPKKVYNIRFASVIAAALAVVIALGIITTGREIVPVPQLPENESIVETVKTEHKNGNNIETIYKHIKKLSKTTNYEDWICYYAGDAKAMEDSGVSSTKKSPSESVVTQTTSKDKDFSQTNTREQNVDEEDIIKTDGDYIYRMSYSDELYIFKADGEKTEKINHLDLVDLFPEFTEQKRADFYAQGMYLHNDKLILIAETYEKFKTDECDCKKCKKNYDSFSTINIFDVKNPKNIKLEKTLKQQGYYDSSRIIGDVLYLNSTMYIDYYDNIKRREKFKYIPSFIEDSNIEYQKDENICLSNDLDETSYNVFVSYDLKTQKRIDDKSIFGSASIGYVSQNNIYFTEEIYGNHDKTQITKFSLVGGKIENKKECLILGSINDTFSLDENGKYLRLVATQNRYSDNSYNSLIILDENLKEVSSIEKLAKGERIYSARFMGDYAYFVTFRETDPLFCADLSDPKNPKILSELKIPGFSDYLHPFGENRLFGFGQSANEKGRVNGVKLSMFDISNKENITEEANEILKKAYSSANYNYKAIVISQERNLICFATGKKDESKYYIYAYDKANGFYEKFCLNVSNHIKTNDYWYYYDNLRGLYIDDYFYVSCNEELIVVDLNNFKVVKTL
ncbi:MAG: beta-propeller domain-containing protein [Clostridia bacterium]|nr:beta-propeller domain-containing protein [Clostridia bacterium]